MYPSVHTRQLEQWSCLIYWVGKSWCGDQALCGNRWAFQNRSEGITNLTHPEVMLPLKELSGIECKKDSRVWTPTIGRMRWEVLGSLCVPPETGYPMDSLSGQPGD